MSEDKVREEFEAWVADFHVGAPLTWYEYDVPEGHEHHGAIIYEDWDVQNTWRAWQASRAALVIDLPETDLTGAIGMTHKAVTKRCRTAIEAAGVKVKP